MNTPIAPSLTLKRHIHAPVATVYAAWTDPRIIRKWFGPMDDAKVSAEADLRVGGHYRFELHEAGGEHHYVLGRYIEIVPNARLVFSWAWESTPERESLVTVEFFEKDGGTSLTLRHENFFDEAARDRHNHGWMGTLVRFERLFA